MTKKWLASLLGAAALTMSGGVLAQGFGTAPSMATVPNFYAGLEIGRADVGDDDDIGFKIFGGYQFHRNIAAEVGYGMLFDKSDVEVTALEFVAVGLFPVANQFSIIGKLGFANVEFDAPGFSDDKTELTYGVGVQFDVNRNLGVRALWQHYDSDPEELDWFTIGAIWRF
jgi:OmpA-OmpF porin, OOP family